MTNILVNPGTTTAVSTIDIGGGVESPRVNLINGTGLSLYGTAGSPPAGSTVLSVQGVSGGFAQPVSGTVTLGAGSAAVGTTTALQGGTWTVQPGNTPNTAPWLVAPAAGVPFPINVTQIGTTAVGTTVGFVNLIRDGAGNARFANVNASSQLSVSVDGGTLSASISSTATIGLNAGTQTIGAVKITDGTSYGVFKGSSISPAATDTAFVVALSPNGLNANGPTTSTNSAPVVIATDQAPVPITYAASSNFVQGTATVTGTGLFTLFSAAGSGNRNYVTSLLVTNAHATASTVININDGTTIYSPIFTGYAVAAGGGFSHTMPVPLRQPTTNTSLSVYAVTTGATVYVTAIGYKGA